jgi:hypothetical protein
MKALRYQFIVNTRPAGINLLFACGGPYFYGAKSKQKT